MFALPMALGAEVPQFRLMRITRHFLSGANLDRIGDLLLAKSERLGSGDDQTPALPANAGDAVNLPTV
jgi:hypothetical protein